MVEAFQHRSGRIEDCTQNESCSFVAGRPVRTLALVSPWAGGNLGNSAILSSVILNLSKRIPSVAFVGVTMSSEHTRRRYGIEAFPLTAASRGFYDEGKSATSEAPKSQSRPRGRIKQWLKRIPFAASSLRLVRRWGEEITHTANAMRMVRRLDGVIVAGGGALDEFWGGPWGHPWNLLKWGVLSRLHRVPFLFVSVGKCSLERPASRFFVRIALRLATYRSYRDPDSKTAVQALIDAPNDPVFPDLAFSHPIPDIRTSPSGARRDGRLVVGISPIAYCDPRMWPLKDEQRYNAYVSRFTEIVKWLLKEGHQLLFFATDGPDLETIKDVMTCIADVPRDSDAILTLPDPAEQSISNHLEAIRQADLVVASRLHGVILSHLIALPVLAISFDPKVDAHMRSVQQMDYCLNIDTFKLDTFIERFEALKGARLRESASLRSSALLFRRQLDLQYDRILGVKLPSDDGRPSNSAQPALRS